MTRVALKAGEPACSNDIWFRPLTFHRHLKGDGTLHHSALKRNAIAAPKNADSPWQRELSGRLASQAGTAENVRNDGENRVRELQLRAIEREKLKDNPRTDPGKDFVFKGAIYETVDNIRKTKFTKADVIFSPTAEDSAHSDIVFFTNDVQQNGSIGFLDDLVSFFQVAPPNEMEKLFDS